MTDPETHEEAEVAHANNGSALPSPAAARQRLGARLRDMRKSAKLTLQQVADEVQRSPATMSRLERGGSVPRQPDIDALLDLYDNRVSGLVTDEIRQLARSLVTESRASDWIEDYRDVLSVAAPGLQRLVELETDAREFLSYQVSVIPGLLQTRDYARATAEVFHPEWNDTQKDRFAEFRMARQDALGLLEARFVINEAALRRPIASADVMREQLKTLLARIDDEATSTTIQIAPDDLAAPEAIQGPFVVMRFQDAARDVVYIEYVGGSTYLTAPDEVNRRRAEFDRLSAAAPDPDASAKTIEEAIKNLPR